MKKTLIHLLSLAMGIIALLASCENELPYYDNNLAPKLTMNAFIYADSLENEIHLSYTGIHQVAEVEDATIEVRVNGELKETLYPPFLLRTCFEHGDVIRLDARTADGKHHAWIEETVPHPVEIQQVDTIDVEKNPHPYRNPFKQLRIKVHFNDPKNEKNYYRIIIEQRATVTGTTFFGEDQTVTSKIYDLWPWDDIALTDGRPATSEELDTEGFIERIPNKYGVFNDNWFKDNKYTLNVQTSLTNQYYNSNFVPEYLNIDIAVRLLSITEAEYYYLSTLNMIDADILDEYISDPVRIPSNVNGGNGFVGISSENGKVYQVIKNKKIEYYDQ